MTERVTPQSFYVVGGTMRPGTASYIERTADTELPKHLLAGELCYVLTSRQMGKSSLMARTHRRLQEMGVHSVTVDLTMIGADEASADRWYFGFAHRVVEGLKIETDLEAWWQERARLPPVQHLVDFFREVVLSATEERVVVFVDEIDTTLSLPYSDDFFAAIRACYNARSTEPEFDRLSFAFLGVAAPSELIKDPKRTPFNIGHQIELADFTLEEATPLAEGLGKDEESCSRVLERVHYWTGGHPYLTQKACRLLAECNEEECRDSDVDVVVRRCFLDAEAQRKDENLRFVRQRLQLVDEKKAVLGLYKRVWAGGDVEDQPLSPRQTTLKLSGLVVPAQGHLAVRNRIYREVFDEEWIREELPVDWGRRMVWAAMILFVLTSGAWYWGIYPQPFVEQIRTAEQDVPQAAVLSVAFSAQDDFILIGTMSWWHLYSIEHPASPRHVASQPVTGSVVSIAGQIPVTEDGLKLPTAYSANSLQMVTLSPHPEEGHVIPGKPAELLKEAERKLSLHFDEQDRLVETYPTPAAGQNQRDPSIHIPQSPQSP